MNNLPVLILFGAVAVVAIGGCLVLIGIAINEIPDNLP
jgi:hypothetical protein